MDYKQLQVNILANLDKSQKDILFWDKLNRQKLLPRLVYKALFFRYRFIRYLYQKSLSKVVQNRTILGTPLFCSLPEHAYWSLFGMLPDEAEVRLAKFLAKNIKENSVFFDIGANIGFYTCMAGIIVGNSGQVHAFEPTPAIMDLLKANSRSSKRIFLNQNALSSSEGDVKFYVNKNNSVANSLLESSSDSAFLIVKTTTLDSYCFDKKVFPDVIKIDAEGSEYDILQGARKLLDSHSPIICLEILKENAGTYKKIRDYLRAFGYNPYVVRSDGDLESARDMETDDSLASLAEDGDNLVFKKQS